MKSKEVQKLLYIYTIIVVSIIHTTTTNPLYFHIIKCGEDKIYAIHTTTFREVERLFPIDP